MPIGRYRGQDIEDIPSNYLKWIAENMDEDRYPEVVEKANEELAFRDTWGKHFYEENV